jgi:CubicO group peptidase (beta-lactamase class C family)
MIHSAFAIRRGPGRRAPHLLAPLTLLLAAGCGGTGSATGPADMGAPIDAPVVDAPAVAGDLGADELDTFVLAKMATARVPGAAAVVVKGGQIILSRAWGLANIEENRPVTPDTVFMLASISKTVSATAMMQLYEQHRFGLDDDVDGALGWTARNPSFPSTPLTYRQLLSHTSSIEDGANQTDYVVDGMDSPITLDDFLKGYLVSGGKYYYDDNWNATHAPGTYYSYSDTGIALAGDLVEKLAGQNLQDYCRAHIFDPLGMKETSWFLRDLDQSHIAMPYTSTGPDQYTPNGYYGYPDYPDGQLRTSAPQLARFLLMFIQSGTYGGAKILDAATVTEMSTKQPKSDDGLGWELTSIGTYDVIGHEGGDNGLSTDMYFDPATGAGFILLTNGDVYLHIDSGPRYDAMVALDEKLLEYGESH